MFIGQPRELQGRDTRLPSLANAASAVGLEVHLLQHLTYTMSPNKPYFNASYMMTKYLEKSLKAALNKKG